MTSPEGKGVLLGAVNSFVIAVATTFHYGEPPAGTISIIVKMALLAIPGVVIGAFAGALAGRLSRFRIPALVGVPCLGMAFVILAMLGLFLRDRHELVVAMREIGPVMLLAFIPTAAAAMVLERWTRPEPSAPGAIARSRRP